MLVVAVPLWVDSGAQPGVWKMAGGNVLPDGPSDALLAGEMTGEIQVAISSY